MKHFEKFKAAIKAETPRIKGTCNKKKNTKHLNTIIKDKLKTIFNIKKSSSQPSTAQYSIDSKSVVSTNNVDFEDGPDKSDSLDNQEETHIPPSLPELRPPVAIDCEMVGLGERGRISSLGRVSIVNYNGQVIYDCFCRPSQPITDYRTPWSGIRAADMRKAIPFDCVQDQVMRIIADRIVVGHSIKNDFSALEMHHPQNLVRDTSRCIYLRMAASLPLCKAPIALRKLTLILLDRNIQAGEHCSAEDAQATMELYRVVEEDWEKDLKVAALIKDPLQTKSCPSLTSLNSTTTTIVTDRPRLISKNRKRMTSYERACSSGYLSTVEALHDDSLLNDEFWPIDD